MRFASLWQRVRRASLHQFSVIILLVTALAGCAEGFAPPDVGHIAAGPVGGGGSRRRGAPDMKQATGQPGTVLSYIIERRTSLTGAFVEVARVTATAVGDLQWFDTDVEPETIYGYRIFALTDLGDRSSPSVVGGVVTPPPPGIQVVTSSLVTSQESLDPDGYELMIAGPDTVRAVISTSATRRFSPLRPGNYTVTLTGVTERCSTPSAVQQVVVTDTLATTIATGGVHGHLQGSESRGAECRDHRHG